MALWGIGAWALLAAGIGALVRATTVHLGLSQASALRLHRPPSPPFMAYRSDSLALVLVSHDPFRTSRRPAEVAYDPLRAASPASNEAAPKPLLVLSGIAWGAAPEAIVEGLPGIEGSRLLRARDVVSGLLVKRIERDRVVIVGMDTIWTLTVREPWR